MDLSKEPRTFTEQFLQAVFAAAGAEGVAAVRRAVGGVKVRLPAVAQPRNWLVKAIGFEAAEKVCSAMRITNADGRTVAGFEMVIPLGENSVRARIARTVEQLLLRGQSVRSISAQLGVGERSVFRSRAKLVAAGRLKRGRV